MIGRFLIYSLNTTYANENAKNMTLLQFKNDDIYPMICDIYSLPKPLKCSMQILAKTRGFYDQ